MPDEGLISWANRQPDWARDSLRRIVSSPAFSLSDEDRQAILDRVRHAAGASEGPAPDCEPICAEHVASAEATGPRTVLLSIGPVHNVDKLAADQRLRFAPNGITLIFGENGSGKSGYARIAKRLCRSLSSDELKSDVFRPTPTDTLMVQVRWQTGSNEIEELAWTPSAKPPSCLKQLSVFDSQNARLYVDQQNRIAYLPTQLAILEHHGELCASLGTRFAEEEKVIEKRVRAALPTGYTPNSKVSILLGWLDPKSARLPNAQDIKTLAGLSNDEREKLASLEKRLASDPGIQAAARRRAAPGLERLKQVLTSAEAALGAAAQAELARLFEAARVATEAAKASAAAQFVDLPLKGVGEGVWRLMYEAARRFAVENDAEVDRLPEQPSDLCVLCHQPLGDVGGARLSRFNSFVASETAKEADAARAALSAKTAALVDLAIPAPEVVAGPLAAYAEMSPARAALLNRVELALASLATRKAALLALEENDTAPIPPMPHPMIEELAAECSALLTEAEELEAEAQHGGTLDEDRARIAEFKDREKLGQDIGVILQRLEDLEDLAALRACQAQVQTRAISTQISSMRRKLVTDGLQARIQAEITRLDLSHIPFVVKDSSGAGQSLFSVGLQGVAKVANREVLSEGEQRALALACFLAEISDDSANYGVIVDDPVSSLDHVRLRRVAERLVEEASKGRQVVIFTHNLVFFNEMVSESARRGDKAPLMKVVIRKTETEGFGLVTEDTEPWLARSVTDRINDLRERAKAAKGHTDQQSDPYRRLAKDFYSDLRETWERAVEEVVIAKTVERLVPDVMTMRLKRVVLSDADYKTIFFAMKRASERSGHDMPAGRPISIPTPEDMSVDVQALDAFRIDYVRRAKEAEKRREALEAPPKAELL